MQNVKAVPSAEPVAPGEENCRICGFDTPIWFTDNALWNTYGKFGILCVKCFTRAAEDAGFKCTGWKLIPEVAEPVAEDRTAAPCYPLDQVNLRNAARIVVEWFDGCRPDLIGPRINALREEIRKSDYVHPENPAPPGQSSAPELKGQARQEVETLRAWMIAILDAVLEDVEGEDPRDPSLYSVRTYWVAKRFRELLDHPWSPDDKLDISYLKLRTPGTPTIPVPSPAQPAKEPR